MIQDHPCATAEHPYRKTRSTPRPSGDLTNNLGALNTNFTLMCCGYHIRIANNDARLKAHADTLLHRLYRARGLTPPPSGTAPTATTQFTLNSSHGAEVFGTLTLGADTGRGLLADGLYRDQIDAFRTPGRRVVEVTRLALKHRPDCRHALARIFNLAFITARHAHQATDAFIEVHPRHAEFYARKLGYRQIGPLRECPRVKAPAVLMHLDLTAIEQRVLQATRPDRRWQRSLYRHFMSPTEQKLVIEQLVVRNSTPKPVMNS